MSDNNSKPNNPPAFPAPYSKVKVSEDLNLINGAQTGMSIRDYFAAKAMQGIVTDPGFNATGKHVYEQLVAETSYKIADAMLKAREL